MENLKKIKKELDRKELINKGSVEELTKHFSNFEEMEWAIKSINSASMYPLLIDNKLSKLEKVFANVELDENYTLEEKEKFEARKKSVEKTCRLEQRPDFDEDRQQAKSIFYERLGISISSEDFNNSYEENIKLINETLSFLMHLQQRYKDNFEFQSYKAFRNNKTFLYLINYIAVYCPKYMTDEMQNYFTEVVRDLQYYATRENFSNSKEYRKTLKHTQKNLKVLEKQKKKQEKVKLLKK